MSSSAAAWFGVITTLLIAILGAVWRIGNKLGGLTSTSIDHESRITKVELHQYEHDQWHLRKGDR